MDAQPLHPADDTAMHPRLWARLWAAGRTLRHVIVARGPGAWWTRWAEDVLDRMPSAHWARVAAQTTRPAVLRELARSLHLAEDPVGVALALARRVDLPAALAPTIHRAVAGAVGGRRPVAKAFLGCLGVAPGVFPALERELDQVGRTGHGPTAIVRVLSAHPETPTGLLEAAIAERATVWGPDVRAAALERPDLSPATVLQLLDAAFERSETESWRVAWQHPALSRVARRAWLRAQQRVVEDPAHPGAARTGRMLRELAEASLHRPWDPWDPDLHVRLLRALPPSAVRELLRHRPLFGVPLEWSVRQLWRHSLREAAGVPSRPPLDLDPDVVQRLGEQWWSGRRSWSTRHARWLWTALVSGGNGAQVGRTQGALAQGALSTPLARELWRLALAHGSRAERLAALNALGTLRSRPAEAASHGS